MNKLNWDGKKAIMFQPTEVPQHLGQIFARLSIAGAPVACLFGGAARDTDLGIYWQDPRTINDYDIRVWIQKDLLIEGWEKSFGGALLKAFEDSTLEMVPSAGTGKLRHVLQWNDIELDISVRPMPMPSSSSQDCAIDRVLDSDASLSAIAIASDGVCWCEAMYQHDRVIRMISYYPQIDMERLKAYREHMQLKFPGIPERMLHMNMQQALDNVLAEMGKMSYEEFRAKLDEHSKSEFAMAMNEIAEFIDNEVAKNPDGEIARLYKEFNDDQK